MITKIRNAFQKSLERRCGAALIRQADGYRDHANWLDAAPLYLRGHALMPWRNDLLIQAANCRKEAGNFADAVRLYRAASEDPRQQDEAGKQIRDVDDVVAAQWTKERSADRPASLDHHSLTPSSISGQILIRPQDHVRDLGRLSRSETGVQTPFDPTNGRPLSYRPGLHIIQIGNFRTGLQNGSPPLLVGVAALRIKIVAYSEADTATVSLDGQVVLEEQARLVTRYPDGRFLYIANLWVDCGLQGSGRRTLEVAAKLQDGTVLSQECAVDVMPMPPAFRLPSSDAFVPSPATRYDDLASEVGNRAATVRDTGEMAMSGEVRSVLAVRIDQLGDLAASLPALRRLREMFVGAHLVALVASELSDIVVASKLVDEVIGLVTEYDVATERRYIGDEEAGRLHDRLAGRAFDIAMDLCPAHDSRRLLLLVEARYRVGFYPRDFPFLDFGVDIVSRDKANDHSTQSHASLILSLVENLHLKARPLLPSVPRCAGSGGILADYGLRAGRYLVVHCGARHAINRWPQERFLELAAMLGRETGLKTVVFLDKELSGGPLADGNGAGPILLGKVPIDAFDAIMSNAHAMIGNDSGPKHLAAVRGTWTASVHINRLNWSEWGQNGPGIIISKKTPCGGCSLNDERLCGKDVACLHTITVEEVFAAIRDNMPRVEPDA